MQTGILLHRPDSMRQKSFLGDSHGYPVVAIHPGGRFFPVKRWRTGGFARVADYLMGTLKAKVVLVGGKDDEELALEIAAKMKHQPLMAAGRTSPKETAAIISLADLFVGNDSAPRTWLQQWERLLWLCSAPQIQITFILGSTS